MWNHTHPTGENSGFHGLLSLSKNISGTAQDVCDIPTKTLQVAEQKKTDKTTEKSWNCSRKAIEDTGARAEKGRWRGIERSVSYVWAGRVCPSWQGEENSANVKRFWWLSSAFITFIKM